MFVDVVPAGLFCLAAIVLLGSPGPAIAALLSIGRRDGVAGGLPFYCGLQVGLALAAAISAAGLFSILQTIPAITILMTAAAILYLLYLSYKIATAPIGNQPETKNPSFASTALGGLILGMTNPKAYVAFISLMASNTLIRSSTLADTGLKWLICVIVMIVVDMIWLWLGVVIQKAKLNPRSERLLNISMAGTIVATTALAFV